MLTKRIEETSLNKSERKSSIMPNDRALWYTRCFEKIKQILQERYRQRKLKNNNEGFHNLHVILQIYVYALAKIRQVKKKRSVEKYAWHDTLSHHASRHRSVPHCDFECLPMCDRAPKT